MRYRYHMSQATDFLSQSNAKLIFHLLNDNYGDKMKTYPNFVTIFKQMMGNIHVAESGSSNLIQMNKILLSECSRLLNDTQATLPVKPPPQRHYDSPPKSPTFQKLLKTEQFESIKSDKQAKKLFRTRLDERVKDFKSLSEPDVPAKLNFEVAAPNTSDFTKDVKDLHAKMMSERSFDMHKITQDYNQKDAQEWINNEAPPLLKIDHASAAEVGAKKPPFAIKRVRFEESNSEAQSTRGGAGLTSEGSIQRATRRMESMQPPVYNPNIAFDPTPPSAEMIRTEAAKALANVKLELEAAAPRRAPTPPPRRALTPPPRRTLTPPPTRRAPTPPSEAEPSTSFLSKLKKKKPQESKNICLRPNEINGNQMKFSYNFGNIKMLEIQKLFLTNTHTKYQNALEQTIVTSLGDEPFLVFSLDINGQEKLKNILFIKKYNDDRTIYYETKQAVSITDSIDNVTLHLFDKDSNAMPIPSFLTIDSRIWGNELHIIDQDQRDFAADKYTYLQFKEGMLSAGEKIIINKAEVEIIGTCLIELNIDKYELEDVDYRNHHKHNYCIVEWAGIPIQSIQHISRIPIVNFMTS